MTYLTPSRDLSPPINRLIDALARAIAEDYLRDEATRRNNPDNECTERVPLSAAGGVA